MTIDSMIVEKIARLARLELQESEIQTMIKDLNSILEWVEQISAVDTHHVDPMPKSYLSRARLRPDRVDDGHYVQDIIANAPQSEFNMFVVPKVVE